MKTRNLLDCYRNFSKKEIREFDKFLKSPFHVNVKSLQKLFKEIINNKDLLYLMEYEKLMNLIVKKLKYSKFMMNKQISLLSNATMEYLKVKANLSDVYNSENILTEYLLTKKNLNMVKSSLDKTSSMLSDVDKINEKTYLYLYLNNSNQLSYLAQELRFTNARNANLRFSILNDALNNFSLYFIHSITHLYINFVTLIVESGNHDKNKFSLDLTKIYSEFEIIVKQNKNEKWNKIFNLYKYLFLTYEHNNNREYFLKYKKLVKNCITELDKSLIVFHYRMLLNFCIIKQRLKRNVDFYKKEELEISYEYFSSDYYQTNDNEYLTATEFHNFILNVYSSGKLDMLKTFIENNSIKLNPSDYNDMVNFGFAYYYLGTKNYKNAIKCINNIELNNFVYKFDIRNVELRIYYEQNKTEFLIEAVKNYREMIINDKILTKSDKKLFLNLIKYINKLINLKNNPDASKTRIEAGYYKKLLNNESPVGLKKWLLEKFSEIEHPESVISLPKLKSLISEGFN